MYFENVKLNDEVYSLIYGHGKVCYVLDKKMRTPGFFMFQVEFKNEKIFYTEDGIPEWCTNSFCEQMVYYKSDLERPESDYTRIDKELLSKKKIIKYKEQGMLEMRTPSGAWRNVSICPPKEFLKAIKDKEFYLFRRAR